MAVVGGERPAEPMGRDQILMLGKALYCSAEFGSRTVCNLLKQH